MTACPRCRSSAAPRALPDGRQMCGLCGYESAPQTKPVTRLRCATCKLERNDEPATVVGGMPVVVCGHAYIARVTLLLPPGAKWSACRWQPIDAG